MRPPSCESERITCICRPRELRISMCTCPGALSHTVEEGMGCRGAGVVYEGLRAGRWGWGVDGAGWGSEEQGPGSRVEGV